MKPKKKENNNLMLWISLGICIGLVIGIMIGMTLQQRIFIMGAVEFAEGLEGTNINIEIDLNETMIIEGFRDVTQNILIPALNNSDQEVEK